MIVFELTYPGYVAYDGRGFYSVGYAAIAAWDDVFASEIDGGAALRTAAEVADREVAEALARFRRQIVDVAFQAFEADASEAEAALRASTQTRAQALDGLRLGAVFRYSKSAQLFVAAGVIGHAWWNLPPGRYRVFVQEKE